MSEFAVVIAARMGSERLPGKALASYAPGWGGTNLGQIIARWRLSEREPVLIVATTTLPEDDGLAATAASYGVTVYRGHPTHLTERLAGALALAPRARWMARALADNPLVEVALADERLDVLAETGAEAVHWGGEEARLNYAATTDILSREAWERVFAASSGSQLEHAGVYLWENLHRFRTVRLPLPRREYLAPWRTELDTPADLEVMRRLFADWHAPTPPPTRWALAWLAAHHEVAALNANVPTRTQSKAEWGKGVEWKCEACAGRLGALVAGDLEIRCVSCGTPRKFYARKPPPPPHRR